MEEKPKLSSEGNIQLNGGTTMIKSKPFVKFKCKRCARKFKDIKSLHDHLQAHRNRARTGKYHCKLCPAIFDDFFEFIRHKKSHRASIVTPKVPGQTSNEGSEEMHSRFESPEGKSNHLHSPQNGRHEERILLAGNGQQQGTEIHTTYGEAETIELRNDSGGNQHPDLSSPGSHVSWDSRTLSDAGSCRPFRNCVKMVGNDSLQISSPIPLKSIYLNSSSPELEDIMNQMKTINSKLDAIIRHFNVPIDSQPTLQSPRSYTKPHTSARTKTSPVSPIPISTATTFHVTSKEQETQEYYASTLGQCSLKSWPQSVSPTMYNTTAVYSFSREDQQGDVTKLNHASSPVVSTMVTSVTKSCEETVKDFMLSEEHIEKLYVVSRSRGNFAKNLTFAVYSPDERQGRNCTGRVFGKAVPKGQLDQTKLNYVKEVTFRRYPCHPSLVDITWKKKCVTAIDSGLRNENRVRIRRHGQAREVDRDIF